MVNNYKRSRSDYCDDDLSAGYRPDSSNRRSHYDDHSRLQESISRNTDRQRLHQSNNGSRFDDTRSQGSSQNQPQNSNRNFEFGTSYRHDEEQHQGIQRKTSFEKFAEERD